MTRLMMLSGGARTPVEPEADPRPVVDDPVVMQMRPDGRRIGLLRVGPGREHTTIHDAITAAYGIQAAKMQAEGVQTITPNYRVDVLVDPGLYADDWVPGQGTGVHVMAADGKRSSATLRYPATFTGLPTDASRGWSPGNLCWWEGIDVQTVPSSDPAVLGPKYPCHGELAMIAGFFATCIISRCKLIPKSNEPGIGTNGGDGAMIVLHDVDVQGGTNQHGWPDDKMVEPMTAVYSKCISNIGLGYGALSDTRPDQVWIVDCTAPNLGSGGAAVRTHVARSTSTNPVGVSGTLDNRADWPVPVGGLSPAARAQYGM